MYAQQADSGPVNLGSSLMVDSGGAGVDYIHFLGQPLAEDAFMIDEMIYRFYTPAPRPPRPPRPPWRPPWRPPELFRLPESRILLGIPAEETDVWVRIGGSVEQTIDNCVAAIESNIYTGVRGVRAVNGMGPILLVGARWAAADSNFPVEESTGGIRLVAGSGEAYSASDPRKRIIITANHSVSDTDVAALAAGCEIPLMCCVAPTAPTFGGAIALRGMGLNVVPFTSDVGFGVRQVGDELWIITIHDAGAVFQSGDALLITAWT